MRFASPNECRTISREALGFYNSVTVGAVYVFTDPTVDIRSAPFFFEAIKTCVERHPTLCVAVKDKHTDKPYYERVPQVNFIDHISIIDDNVPDSGPNTSENARIEAALTPIVDQPWGDTTAPPWKIFVMPLTQSSTGSGTKPRCFVGFAFSHALGDGNIGTSFHRTFLDTILNPTDAVPSSSVVTPDKELPAPFDTPERLPISWKFLLRPFLAVLLPKFLVSLLGLRATSSAVNANTWTGSKIFFDPKNFTSHPIVLEIDSEQVENALRKGRMHGARLTSVINQFIVRALSRAIPDQEFTNFVSGTAVDMRSNVGLSKDEMGLYVNGYFGLHDRQDDYASPLSEEAWAEARTMTQQLAECAVTLQDQAVGLLRYVPSIKKWTASKIGKERDCSFATSNLGAFDMGNPAQESADEKHGCKITKMVFARPVDAVDAPISFTMMSIKGGSLVITVTWQEGALGVPIETEASVVDTICKSLKRDFEQL